MDIIKLSVIAVISAILTVFLKQYKNEYALLCSLGGGIVLLCLALPYMRDVLAEVGTIAARAGLDNRYIGAAIKVIAVTLIAECSASLCRDAGESALAAKLEIAAKLIILALTMPVATSLFDTILSILP
ncbi:MAG: SpoIIIAC/SpoIIIAD family protein [Clostridia bacterium]|nr:SpoIIIAC/SpoIIIAD family protein [Clostridia bacterium]